MLIDTHVHTNRYSSCSVLDPVTLVHRASRLGLSGIAIVEHNNIWSQQEVGELRRETSSELLILRGQEVSCSLGHLLVFGYPERLPLDLPAEELMDRVHDHGGVVVVAHPFRNGSNLGAKLAELEERFALVDGIEVLTSNHSEQESRYAEEVSNVLSIASLGGSDAHSVGVVGKYLTWFPDAIGDEDDFVAGIRVGRCKPIRYKEKNTYR